MKKIGQVDCYYAGNGKWYGPKGKGIVMKDFMKKFESLKTKDERNEAAVEIFNSIRGQYIIGQALFLAIEHLEEKTPIMQEPSNMADMGLMMEQLFPMYAGIQEARTEFEKERVKDPAVVNSYRNTEDSL